MRIAFIALLLVAVTTPARAQNAFRQDSLAFARQLTSWLYDGQVDSLFKHHSVDAKARLRNSLALQDGIDELRTRGGKEEEVLAERFVKRKGRTQYWRTARFSQASEPLTLRFALNERGQITGMSLRPRSEVPAVDTK
jgi:hypothetical protein